MATANTTAIAKVEPQGAVALHWSNEQVDTIRRTVARDANDTELKMFLHLSETYGLDPFAKEIWCIKMGGRPTIMTSRDGYLKIANRNPHFKGMRADVVYEGDSFQKVGDEVKHVYGIQNRGKPVGAYCFVYRDDRNYPIYVYAPFRDYYKSGGTWNTYPHAMILKVAEAQALKRAFSISGLVTQEELDNGDVYVVENNGPNRRQGQPSQGRDLKKELWNGFLSCCGDANKAKAEMMKITEGRGSAEWTDEDLKSLEAALVVYKNAKAPDATSSDMLKGAIQNIKSELWQGFLNVCNADAEKAKAEIMKITEGRGSADWTELDMTNLRRVLDEKVLEAIDVQYTEEVAMAEAADAAGMPVPQDESPIKEGQGSDNTVDLREKMISDINHTMGEVGLGYTKSEREAFYAECTGNKNLEDIPISGLSKILFEARKILDERIAASL